MILTKPCWFNYFEMSWQE